MKTELGGCEQQHLLSPAKQYGHYDCMRKPDFDTVDEAISSAFENGKIIVVCGVVDDALQ
jgi:hypothetical protein